MTMNDVFHALGPGVRIAYLAVEDDGLYHCELALPRDRYDVSLVTDCGPDPDTALVATVEKAMAFRIADGWEKAA